MSGPGANPAKAPSAGEMELALRDAIVGYIKADNFEELTLKRVRAVAEKALGLAENFFKTDGVWKNRSKDFVHEEVSRQEEKLNTITVSRAPPRSPATDKSPPVSTPAKPPSANKPLTSTPSKSPKPIPSAIPKSPAPKASSPPNLAANIGTKRKSAPAKSLPAKSPPAKSPPFKKAKKAVLPDEDDDSPRQRKGQPSKSASSKPNANSEDSDSSLSSVLDEAPRKKKAGTEKKRIHSKEKTPKSTAKPSMDTQHVSPDDEEIKRLQGWLIKCGIRKMWYRELAPFDTPKEKIAHLKGLLRDAGMDGRYSVEKARQIREERELKADLEAVQEGERMWGNADGGEEGGKRKRPVPKALQELEFLAGDSESD